MLRFTLVGVAGTLLGAGAAACSASAPNSSQPTSSQVPTQLPTMGATEGPRQRADASSWHTSHGQERTTTTATASTSR